jgi:hypothetical protein
MGMEVLSASAEATPEEHAVASAEEQEFAKSLSDLKVLEAPRILLLITSLPLALAEKAALRYFAEAEVRCVFPCVDRPQSFYLEELKGVLDPRLFYTVEAGEGAPARAEGNRVRVDSVTDLGELSRGLDRAVRNARAEGVRTVLLFSALPTLSLYQDVRALGRFMVDQISRLRAQRVVGVVVVPPSPELERMLRPMADRVIEVQLRPEERLARAFG